METIHEYVIVVVSIVGSATVSILGFFLKRVINRVDRMQTELTDHKEKDVEKYATKDEMRRQSDDYKAFLEAIISPVNRKLESIELSLRADIKK